jgi:hypothetical protein
VTARARRRSLPALAAVLALCAPAAASAAEPRVEVKAPGNGPVRAVTVRLTDPKSGAPVDGARITAIATMTHPHLMSMPPIELSAEGGGRYGSRVQFEMRAPWTVTMRVAGRGFAPVFTTFEVDARTRDTGQSFRVVSAPPGESRWIEVGLFVSLALALLGGAGALLLWRRQRAGTAPADAHTPSSEAPPGSRADRWNG